MSTSLGGTPAMPEWSTSYSQFLARSAEQTANTLKLYQEAMEQVARGKLSPSIFQDHFPQFAQARGGEYSSQFAEVGANFLSDLVQLGSTLPSSKRDDPDPEIAPPSFDPVNPARWFEQLAEYAGLLNGRALKAYRSQLDRVAAGEATPSEVQQSTSEYLSQQLPDYLGRLTKAYFDLLNGMNEVRARYEREYFQGVLAWASADSESRLTLTLAALSDTTASASLSIANTTRERIRVNYTTTDIRRADGGGPAFQPSITIRPEPLELEPDEEAEVTLSLTLDSAKYDPDVLYKGTLYIRGGNEFGVEVQLRIMALPSQSAADASQSAGV